MLNFPYIPREIGPALKAGTLSLRAELLLGPRQVGKTTLLEEIVRSEKHIKLTGEDEDDLLTLADPKSYLPLTRLYPNIIIDEAQFVPEIGRVIKRLVDGNESGARIFVTGSSALDLNGQLKESAAGRFNAYQLWPFSLEELAARSGWIEVKRQMQERLVYGCYPAVVNDPAHAREYLLDFADSVLYKDLFRLAEVRKPTDLTRLVRYLAACSGSEIRFGAAASELGIQSKTVERYVDLLEACFIVKVVPSWSRNPITELKKSKKIYFCDTGIRNALLRDFTPYASRPDKGALWENLFFTERLKRHAFRRDGGEIYFWRTRTGHEVDFLEVVNGTIAAFECGDGTKQSSLSLRAFKKRYPAIPVTVVSPATIDAPEAPAADLATAFGA